MLLINLDQNKIIAFMMLLFMELWKKLRKYLRQKMVEVLIQLPMNFCMIHMLPIIVDWVGLSKKRMGILYSSRISTAIGVEPGIQQTIIWLVFVSFKIYFTTYQAAYFLKVSLFQNVFMKSSFGPKYQRNFLIISALALSGILVQTMTS